MKIWIIIIISILQTQTLLYCQLSLELSGGIKLGDADTPAPGTEAGTIRWNSGTNDFEGWSGVEWISLTNQTGGSEFQSTWGSQAVTENYSITPGNAGDQLGISVDISGDYAIIGANGADVDGNNNQGNAYIFERQGGKWDEIAKLTSSDGNIDDQFGYSVSIDSHYAVIGAYKHDSGGNLDQGKAYIFEKPVTGWKDTTESFQFTGIDSEAGDLFGICVDIQGDLVIVGANYHDTGGNIRQGKAYVFERQGGPWLNIAILSSSDGAADDRFGRTLDIDGDFIIVGAPLHDMGGNLQQGKAYIFEKPASGWTSMTETFSLSSSDGSSDDWFGIDVRINDNYAIVGSPLKEVNNQTNQGMVYLFEKPANGWTTMTETAKLTNPDAAEYDQFGTTLAVHNNFVIISAWQHNTSGNTGRGKAYIYERPQDGWTTSPVPSIQIIASDGDSGDKLGVGLSISDQWAIVSSIFHDTNGNIDQGKVYFYSKG